MRNVLLIFAVFVLYGCTNDPLFDISDTPMTRSTNDFSNYYFNSSLKEQIFDYKGEPTPTWILTTSYKVNDNGVIIDLLPQVISKPSWVNTVNIRNVESKLFITLSSVTENISSMERSGTLILSQPESNKTLSFQLIQGTKNNLVTVSITTIAKNRYEYSISTQYPVKDNYVGVEILYEVYNDSDTMSGRVILSIPKGAKSDSTIKDYNGSPIVYYHGDLKGCRLLSPISISSNDNFYDYVLAP